MCFERLVTKQTGTSRRCRYPGAANRPVGSRQSLTGVRRLAETKSKCQTRSEMTAGKMLHLRIAPLVIVLLMAAMSGCADSGTSPSGDARLRELALRADFAILDHDPRPMPPKLDSRLASTMEHEFHETLRPTATWFAPTAHGGAWIAVASNHLCLISNPDGALACAGIGSARARGLAVGSFDPPASKTAARNYSVLGVAPDRVAAITLRIGTRRSVVLPKKNVYSVHAQRPIEIEGFRYQDYVGRTPSG